MPKERVAAYYDGFNLYHAIDDLQQPHLKWVDLQKLARQIIRPQSQQIVAVRYFSAPANHYSNTPLYEKLLRHREYVRALEANLAAEKTKLREIGERQRSALEEQYGHVARLASPISARGPIGNTVSETHETPAEETT